VESHFETYISPVLSEPAGRGPALNWNGNIETRNITHVMVDGATVPEDEVEKRRSMAVPSVYSEMPAVRQGRNALLKIVNKLDAAPASARPPS